MEEGEDFPMRPRSRRMGFRGHRRNDRMGPMWRRRGPRGRSGYRPYLLNRNATQKKKIVQEMGAVKSGSSKLQLKH
ncbi:hypothetical protein OESDEN_17079 [Oesophagostomum dentatum]|uniref:Uncharacterized protein n=1 Tax=Oesophagostomum dentatum TaxID=61180 RepID=A0A0B1SE76_OESDE|nr:hypothetical protein OESDEN_17079 [Oesophagostomum dentatum]